MSLIPTPIESASRILGHGIYSITVDGVQYFGAADGGRIADGLGVVDSVKMVATEWFAADGSSITKEVPLDQCTEVHDSTPYWDAVCLFLDKQFPNSKKCKVGQSGTKPECDQCSWAHLSRNVDPYCVDHG